jgi:uncharacterized surface protein with fasciclin (FAS1) repeats
MKGEFGRMIRQRTNRFLAAAAAAAFAASTFAAFAPAKVSANNSTPPAANATGAATADIVETAVAAGDFKTLAAALRAAGLVEALKGRGPFTVFAPTDEAFAKLPAGTVEMLLRPENREKLRAVLLYHVVEGKVVAADVMRLNGKDARTLQGGKVKVRTKGGVMVGGAKVLKTDVMATNGVIHVIDTVLMPKTDGDKMD